MNLIRYFHLAGSSEHWPMTPAARQPEAKYEF